MDPRTRKLAGWVLAAAGVAVAVVGAFADQLGLGANDDVNDFGPKQIIALVVGLALLVIGLALALLPLGENEST